MPDRKTMPSSNPHANKQQTTNKKLFSHSGASFNHKKQESREKKEFSDYHKSQSTDVKGLYGEYNVKRPTAPPPNCGAERRPLLTGGRVRLHQAGRNTSAAYKTTLLEYTPLNTAAVSSTSRKAVLFLV